MDRGKDGFSPPKQAPAGLKTAHNAIIQTWLGVSCSGRLSLMRLIRRFWLLRLLALGFLGLRPFLCVRLGSRLRLREATAHTTQHSHEHLITPLLTSTPTSAASMMRFMEPPTAPSEFQTTAS